MVVTIRQAHIEDAMPIKNLVFSLSRFYTEDKSGKLPGWFMKTLELSEFEQRILSSHFKNYVYCDNEMIVGYVSLKNSNHLYHLFVMENFQGKGIAKALWNHVLKITPAESLVVRSSIYAVPVYQSFGFVASGNAMSKDGISFQPMEFSRPVSSI